MHEQTGQPLSGFAVDLTIRFQKDGAGFLQDHNYPGDTADGTWPHNNLAELKETLNGELDRLYAERFGNEAKIPARKLDYPGQLQRITRRLRALPRVSCCLT